MTSSRGESDSILPQDAHSVPWENLDRYLFGDDQAIEQWLATHPDSRAELEAVRTAVQDPMPEAPVATGDQLWAAMSERMTGAHRQSLAAATARRSAAEWRKRSVEWVGIAAVALVAIIAVRPHFQDASAISGRLPLDAIPDSNVVASAPAPAPVASTPTAPAPAAPAAPVQLATNTVSTNHSPTRTTHTSTIPLADKDSASSLASSKSAATLTQDASLRPSDLTPPPVATTADEPPGAANTDWP